MNMCVISYLYSGGRLADFTSCYSVGVWEKGKMASEFNFLSMIPRCVLLMAMKDVAIPGAHHFPEA